MVMPLKLGLDQVKVAQARSHAHVIATDMQEFINLRTTQSVERTVCRLMGIDGADEEGWPYPNRVVEKLEEQAGLAKGAALCLGATSLKHDLDGQKLAEAITDGTISFTVPEEMNEEIQQRISHLCEPQIKKIVTNRQKRLELMKELSVSSEPLLYAIVATGNIYEDVLQARSAARAGADIIAVIRSTGQSLLDYVPYGPTTEGFGGTYATQENFRIMRDALDEVSQETGHYVQLVNYCSGLCMPEIAIMGAFERLDMMLNDAMYGILFRDINMHRTMVDQYYSRMINAFAGVVINTGEDNYLTTADAVEAAHTVLASQFINEQFGLNAGLSPQQLGLGHAFEIRPDYENGFLYEVAQAQMAREIFPDCPLKYMPPTRHMTGDIFLGQVQDAMFNFASVMTGQSIHLLGMLTEAIHTPHISDRFIAVENARYIMQTAKDFGAEITFKEDGIIANRAKSVLDQAVDLLSGVARQGLFKAIEEKTFANISRKQDGGKGAQGVSQKHELYQNPLSQILLKQLPLSIGEIRP